MAHNEFRVAGAGSGRDPWFAIRVADFPWLRHAGVQRAELSPDWLRQAFVAFFLTYHAAPGAHREPERKSLSAVERRGAGLFRDRCEGCHQARLFSDDPGTRLREAALSEGESPRYRKVFGTTIALPVRRR